MDPMDLGTMGWGMLGTTAWEPAPATGVRLDTIEEGHMNILDFFRTRRAQVVCCLSAPTAIKQATFKDSN